MPITSISYQPPSESINAAYRPIVFRCKAQVPNATSTNYVPPVVYCDIYVGGTYYKTISRSQWITDQNLTPEYEFDIQDAIQELMGYNLPEMNGSVIEEFTQTIKTVFVKFRNAVIDGNGFTKSEQTAPIQGTSNSNPVAGDGEISNEIYVLNSTIQHEENQNLTSLLDSYKTNAWLNDAYPLTKRPKIFKMCKLDSSFFPILSKIFPKKICVKIKKKDGTTSTTCSEKTQSCPMLQNINYTITQNLSSGNQSINFTWDNPPNMPVMPYDIKIYRRLHGTTDWGALQFTIYPTPITSQVMILPLGFYDFVFEVIGQCIAVPFSNLPYLDNIGVDETPVPECVNPTLTNAMQTSGESVLFEWDNNGYNYGSGTALLQYSLDNGNTWNTVGTVNPANSSVDQYSQQFQQIGSGSSVKLRVQVHGNGCSNMSSNEIDIVWERMGAAVYGQHQINPVNIISANASSPKYNDPQYGGSYSICVTGNQFTKNLKINTATIVPGQTRLFLMDGTTPCTPGNMASLDMSGSSPTQYNEYGIRWIRFVGYDANGIHLGNKIFDVNPSTGIITGESTNYVCP